MACGAGSYQTADSSTFCSLCPPGSSHGFYGQVTEFSCIPCEEGTYASARGSSLCHGCAPGTFQSMTGGTLCEACAPGTFHGSGGTRCAHCPAGTFGTGEGVLAERACTLCSPGTFSSGMASTTSAACLACEPGRYSTGAGQGLEASCVACAGGTFASPRGDSCVACGRDEFCPEGSSRATPCVEGLVCNGTHLDALPGLLPVFLLDGNCTDAIPCPPGTRCSQLIPGDKGVLTSRPHQQTHFVVYEGGPYSLCGGRLTYGYRRVEQFEVEPPSPPIPPLNLFSFFLLPMGCKPGYFLLYSACRPCPNGTFSTEAGSLSPDTCKGCAPGSFGPSQGATACSPCALGAYEPATGMSVCRQCLPGTFQPSLGGSGCFPCPPGSSSEVSGASACDLCAAGTVQPGAGGSSCSACNSSTEYSSEGDAVCLPCGQPSTRPLGCEPAVFPENSEDVWISVRGLHDDGCAAIWASSSDAGSTVVRARSARLYPGSRCRRDLVVLGRPELSSLQPSWIGGPGTREEYPLSVVPVDEVFYPDVCARGGEGFGVLFTGVAPNATFEILDPSGRHLLFRGGCEPVPGLAAVPMSRCHTMRFCPIMDILVRVRLPSSGLASSVSLSVGGGSQCPPVSGWVAALELHNRSVPFFQGDTLRIDVRLLNPPLERLLAFRFAARVRPGFRFLSFTSSSVPAVQQTLSVDGRLVVEGDVSSQQTRGSGMLLGQLVLQLDARHTGVLRAVRVEQGSFQCMLLAQGERWFAVGVQTAGYTCRRDGFVEAMVDFPRVTRLVVRARRSQLVHWRGVQQNAPVFPTGVDVLGVWNNRSYPTTTTTTVLQDAVCSTSTSWVLHVASCTRITPVGAGTGRLLVDYRHGVPGRVLLIRVLQPAQVSAFLGPSNRLRVQATLLGMVLDVSPYVLGSDTPLVSSGGVTLSRDGLLSCNPGFVGNYTVGVPVLHRGECLQQPRVVLDPGSNSLFLLGGTWTTDGDFRLRPSVLTADSDSLGLLLFRAGAVLFVPHAAVLESTDSSRAVVVRGNTLLRLVRTGQTPRCVGLFLLGQHWKVPVVPPAPASLSVQLAATKLVVQQDMWRLVPSTSTLVTASVWFTDGTSMDVRERLVWQVDPEYLAILPDGGGGVQALARAGRTNVSFALPGFSCLQASAEVQIFVSSVLSTTLLCQKCPEQLVARADPLSVQWPFRFPSAISIDSFVVKRLLVDGSTHEGADPLQAAGAGALEGDLIVALRAGELSVSTAFARNIVDIPVVERFAVGYSVLCNNRACTQQQKLAPPHDGAGMPPFRYATCLELALELVMFDGSVSRFSWLPQVSITTNGNASTSLVALRPGPLEIRVEFGTDWRFSPSFVEFSLRVENLASLRLQVPPVLYQLHCTRLWERGPVSVLAVLSDGVEADVRAGLAVDGQILRLDPTHAFVEVEWPGEGHVNASFGGMRVSAKVLAALDSTLFAALSLDAVPEQWVASLGARASLHAILSPIKEIGDPALVVQRVVHWRVEPQGIVDLDEAGWLTLLSDFYEPVAISGTIRGCQMSVPASFHRSIQVNVVPDREGQVDFGAEQGPPLPQALFGSILEIPLFLFATKPVQAYRAVISLPGVDLFNCTPGEIPFGACSAPQAELSASYPASQRVGRLWIGTVRGRVLLDNAVSRLRVSVQGPAWMGFTYSFAVRLGAGGIQPVAPLANAFSQGFSELSQPESQGWPIVASRLVFSACCDLLAVGPGSPLSNLYPTSFRLQNLTLDGSLVLDLGDPRIRVDFDELILRLDPFTAVWAVEQDAQEYAESTSISIRYTHPGTLETREAVVRVSLAKEGSLHLQPVDELLLLRVHCSEGVFQTKQVNATLILRSGQIHAVSSASSSRNVSLAHAQVASARWYGSFLLVTGLSPGATSLVLQAYGLQAVLAVRVLNESIPLVSVRLPDPYVLTSPKDGRRALSLTGLLADGTFLPSLSFLSPVVTTDGPVRYDLPASLVALGNTHPSDRHTIRASIPACASSSSTGKLTAASPLWTRLAANLTSRYPADVTVDATEQDFNVTLSSLHGVSAFLVHLRGGPLWIASCSPGPDQPAFGDCVALPETGELILVGVYPGKQRHAPAVLATVSPMPRWFLGGHLELFAGVSSLRLPITAGRFGSAFFEQQPAMPVADPATLARQYALALQRPWDAQAMRDAQFTLQLLAGRQRLVDPRSYSSENELSLLFRVTDRFFQPDTNRTSIQVLFHTRRLPPHPDASDAQGGAVKVPARHVVDGWYAVQWVGRKMPRLALTITYEVSTSTSIDPWTHSFPHPVITGRPVHDCPRFATDQASFLVLYRIPPTFDPKDLARRIACSVQVAARRVTVTGPDALGGFAATIGVESFIRMHQVHQALTSMNATHPTTTTTAGSDGRRRRRRQILQDTVDPAGNGVQRVGLLYVNDTADPVIPCPPGTFFTPNGTYQALPSHSVAGPDCYGMSCIDGYTLLGAACVPASVSLDLVWVCVIVILSVIGLCSCILCALHMGHRKSLAPLEPVELHTESSFPDSLTSEPFGDDDGEFRNIVLGSYLDDFSRMQLDPDDEFASPEPFRSDAGRYRDASK